MVMRLSFTLILRTNGKPWITKTTNQLETHEDYYQEALDYMAERLEELEPVINPNQSFASSTMRSESASLSLMHLPSVQLPPFSGKYHLVNKNGRIEKSIDAHKGATTVGRWSSDGSALLTAGEDGLIKIWSRSGMLRSTLVKASLPILTSSWSPDCSMILYSQGGNLLLQSFNSNSKPYKWHAHDNLTLVACWNPTNGLIVSGGEDCKYKVWDAAGHQLYSSNVGDHPVTAISWCHSSGSYFAVGSFNTIKLCDKNGWSHSMEKVNTGSIYSIAWSSDSTQVAMACSNGKLLTGHIIDRFPRKDTLQYNKWLQAIPPDLITLQRNIYICCTHFCENSFQPSTPTGKNILKEDAIPSIFYSGSEDARDENNIFDNFTREAEKTMSQGQICETAIKRVSVDINTQVSPKKQRILEKNTQLQRKVHILQQRLRRRELTITTMRNLIDTLKTNNMHNSDLEQKIGMG
ncbi:uncharacterized protein Oseg5 isoform X2 [Temnothorax longispinosus]|uniref:uncharacterized protein Oseg5 isoform X2 n=1 Tax=Temnothorax longispinosus TaxID=300112 RepID=UPI003A9912F2